MDGIMVLTEQRGNELREISFELLGLARSMGRGLGVSAVLLEGEHHADALRGSADAVDVLHGPGLAEGETDAVVNALCALITEQQPRLVLAGHTAAGIEVAPALATRLGLAIQTDCLEVQLEGAGLHLRRHLYGGKLVERLELGSEIGFLLTVRPGSWTEVDGDGRGTEIRHHRPELGGDRNRRVLGQIEAAFEDVDISQAEILVAVGRGLGSPDNLEPVRELAETIGATLACSRPVADKGWLSKSHQVGSSGQVVRPRLYIALGISGAYQHVVGMRGAATIVAVNSDPQAPIFEVAHHGIVADMHEVVPELTGLFCNR
jgi:electron transfer flavoprotein alpha subunit